VPGEGLSVLAPPRCGQQLETVDVRQCECEHDRGRQDAVVRIEHVEGGASGRRRHQGETWTIFSEPRDPQRLIVDDENRRCGRWQGRLCIGTLSP
jgi:hypothetical protein